MAVDLLICQSRECHNSVVTLLGALEREGLMGDPLPRLISPERIVAEYEAGPPDDRRRIVVFSLASCDLAWCVEVVRRLVSVRRPGDLIVAGGPHPTAADETVLALGVDAVFRGEGDLSFPCFVRAVLGGGDWRAQPGLSFFEQDCVVRNPEVERIDIDCVRSTCSPLKKIAPLELTRGCPYACRFCQTPTLWGRRPRHRSPDSVLEALSRYRTYVRFLAPNAFGYRSERPGVPNERAIVGLLEAVRKRYPAMRMNFGVFPGEVRPEYVRRELVRAIRPLVTNRYLAIGAQSGSDRVLRNAWRGHTVADVLRAVETIRGEGMGVLVDILFGLPGETAEDVRQTLGLMERIASCGGRLRVHVFTPLPGTEFASAPPAPPLDAQTRDVLARLSRGGVVDGNWVV